MAIPLFEASLAGFERVLGAEHSGTVTVRSNLAGARRDVEGQGSSPIALRRGRSTESVGHDSRITARSGYAQPVDVAATVP